MDALTRDTSASTRISHAFASIRSRSSSAFFFNFINKIVIIKLNAVLGNIVTQKPRKLPKMFKKVVSKRKVSKRKKERRHRKGPTQSPITTSAYVKEIFLRSPQLLGSNLDLNQRLTFTRFIRPCSRGSATPPNVLRRLPKVKVLRLPGSWLLLEQWKKNARLAYIWSVFFLLVNKTNIWFFIYVYLASVAALAGCQGSLSFYFLGETNKSSVVYFCLPGIGTGKYSFTHIIYIFIYLMCMSKRILHWKLNFTNGLLLEQKYIYVRLAGNCVLCGKVLFQVFLVKVETSIFWF